MKHVVSLRINVSVIGTLFSFKPELNLCMAQRTVVFAADNDFQMKSKYGFAMNKCIYDTKNLRFFLFEPKSSLNDVSNISNSSSPN